jgi:hypothetical protein
LPIGRRHRPSPRIDVFPPERDGPDGALNHIVVEFDAAVIEKSGEGWRTRERVANGLGEEPAGGTRPNSFSSQAFIVSMSGRVLVLRTCRCASVVRPWIYRKEFGDPPEGLGGDR